jgi:hypothetical protein
VVAILPGYDLGLTLTAQTAFPESSRLEKYLGDGALVDELREIAGRELFTGLIVVCFSRFWVRGLPFPDARYQGHPFQWKNTLPWHLAAPPKSESFASKSFRHSGMTVAFKTTFEVFTRVGPDNSLERLAERSVGLVTDRPSDVYELLVTLFE